MTKKRASNVAINGYIRLPRVVRRFTDPVVRGQSARAEKGKKRVVKALKGKK